ncbi:MAG: hypothetical protein ABJA98_24315 [Acidobacteriota bacterium]
MKRTLGFAVAVSLACSTSMAAQIGTGERTHSLLDAVVAEASTQAPARTRDSTRGTRPPPGWQVVRLIDPGVEISMILAGSGQRLGQFVSATDDELIVKERRWGRDERIDRDDVLRITVRRTTHERSAKFAAGGAALGAVAGLLSFASLAFKQCGGSCTDEKILLGLSIFGLPVAGGVLGWQLSATRTTVLVYERSA